MRQTLKLMSVILCVLMAACAHRFNFSPPAGKSQSDIDADYTYCGHIARQFAPSVSAPVYSYRSPTTTHIPGSVNSSPYRSDPVQDQAQVDAALSGIAANSNQGKILKHCLESKGYSIIEEADDE